MSAIACVKDLDSDLAYMTAFLDYPHLLLVFGISHGKLITAVRADNDFILLRRARETFLRRRGRCIRRRRRPTANDIHIKSRLSVVHHTRQRHGHSWGRSRRTSVRGSCACGQASTVGAGACSVPALGLEGCDLGRETVLDCKGGCWAERAVLWSCVEGSAGQHSVRAGWSCTETRRPCSSLAIQTLL